MVEAHAQTIFGGHSSCCTVCKFVDITEIGKELAYIGLGVIFKAQFSMQHLIYKHKAQ